MDVEKQCSPPHANHHVVVEDEKSPTPALGITAPVTSVENSSSSSEHEHQNNSSKEPSTFQLVLILAGLWVGDFV